MIQLQQAGSTKLYPYQVTFAHEPIIPSEAAQKFMQLWTPSEGDKEDVINGSAQKPTSSAERCSSNLAIAQHRDT